jgi:hypothetical protein
LAPAAQPYLRLLGEANYNVQPAAHRFDEAQQRRYRRQTRRISLAVERQSLLGSGKIG